MDILSALRLRLERARGDGVAIPLAIVLASSPLPPLSTLRHLKSLEVPGFEDLPDFEQVLDGDFPPGCSPRLRKVLEAAALAQQSGSTEVVVQRVEEEMDSIEVSLELADYQLSQFYQVLSVFVTLVPSIVATMLVFLDPRAAVDTILGLAAFAVGASLLGFVFFPGELRLPAPPRRALLPMVAIAPAYAAASLLGAPHPALLAVALGSSPTAILSLSWTKEELEVLEEALELVRRACAGARYSMKTALRLDEREEGPEFLLSSKWFGVARGACTALYLLAFKGGRKLEDCLARLERYTRRYVEALRKFRSRTASMMLLTAVEAAIVALIYAVVIATASFFAGLATRPEFAGAGGLAYGFKLPSQEDVAILKSAVDLALALDAVALAIATALCREGDPRFAPTYLPLIAGVTLASYSASAQWAPSLFAGW